MCVRVKKNDSSRASVFTFRLKPAHTNSGGHSHMAAKPFSAMSPEDRIRAGIFTWVPPKDLTDEDNRIIADLQRRLDAREDWDSLEKKWAADQAREDALLPAKKAILAEIAELLASADMHNPYTDKDLVLSIELLQQHLLSAQANVVRALAHRDSARAQ